MTYDVDAIYDRGVFRPLEPLILNDGTPVHLRVEEKSNHGNARSLAARVHRPRLADPNQVAEFAMEVAEIPDAGV